MKVCDWSLTIQFVTFTAVIFVSGCHGQIIIGPMPINQAVLLGDTHILNCSKEAAATFSISWYDYSDGDNIHLYFGNIRLTNLPKYNNFAFYTDIDRSDLVISNTAIDDEGTYYCILAGTEIWGGATRTVEVRSSSLQMTKDGKDYRIITAKEGEQFSVVCTALGSRPAVMIMWYHQMDGGTESKLDSGMTQVNTSVGDGTFNTVSTLQYFATKSYNDGRLSCITSGQEVAENRTDFSTLNVQYSPNVTMSYEYHVIYCSSDANPVVASNDYLIIINDATEYIPTCSGAICTLPFEVVTNTHVRCNATNVIGTGTFFIIAKPDKVIPTTDSVIPSTSQPTVRHTAQSTLSLTQPPKVFSNLLWLWTLIVIPIAIFVDVVFCRCRKQGTSDKSHNDSKSSKGCKNSGYEDSIPLAFQKADDNAYQKLNESTKESNHTYQELGGLRNQNLRSGKEEGSCKDDMNSASRKGCQNSGNEDSIPLAFRKADDNANQKLDERTKENNHTYQELGDSRNQNLPSGKEQDYMNSVSQLHMPQVKEEHDYEEPPAATIEIDPQPARNATYSELNEQKKQNKHECEDLKESQLPMQHVKEEKNDEEPPAATSEKYPQPPETEGSDTCSGLNEQEKQNKNEHEDMKESQLPMQHVKEETNDEEPPAATIEKDPQPARIDTCLELNEQKKQNKNEHEDMKELKQGDERK